MSNNPVDFSRRSRRAIIIFTILLLIVVLIPRFILLFRPPDKIVYYYVDDVQKEGAEEFNKQHQKSFSGKYSGNRKNRYHTPPLRFDPNQYKVEDWVKLGLTEKQSGVIVSYNRYGFYSHEDLKKVFVISDEFFQVIKDSLVYPEKPDALRKKTDRWNTLHRQRIININDATKEELMELKGIGEFYAENIIRYRDKLGGFVGRDQLLEIKKMDVEKLEQIEPFILIDPQRIQQIDINEASVEELKSHPYISWNVANSIVKLRAQTGGYKKIEELKRSVLIDDHLFEKIKPYITIHNK